MSEEFKKPFIPIWMDQAGFTPHQYRIVGHFWSRGQGTCFPSLETIATCCKVNIKTVKRTIKELEILGFVQRSKRKAPGVRFSNEYILTGPNQAPVKSQPAQKEPPLTGPNQAPPNRPKRDPGNDTPLSDTSLNENNVVFPFKSEAFREAWNDWQQHRREKKIKLTPLTIQKQLKQLAAMGESNAIAAIDHSIGKGWTGIFPATSATTTQTKSKEFSANDCSI